MAFDLQQARADGAADTDIAGFLAQKHGFDLERARAEGVTDTEVVEFLAPRPIARTPAPPATTQPIAPAAPEKSLARRTVERVSDVGLDLAKGVVGLGESVVGAADLVTGNLAGEGLAAVGYDPARTRQIIESGYSDARKTENAAVQRADGFADTTAALFENPAVALGSVVESAPLMLGSAAAVRATAARLLARAGIAPGTQAAAQFLQRPEIAARLATVGSAAEGATAAGSIQEQARQQGRSWSESAPYAAAGGAGTAIIGKAASKLLPDADVAAGVAGLGAGQRLTAREAAGRVGKGVIQEGVVEELPQSAQEQVAQNLATGRPWDEGVGSAAAQGMVAGMGMGAGATGARAAADMRAPQIDATTGLEFSADAIDAAVRAALNPVNAQLERIEPVLQQREAAAASGDPLDAQIIRLENEAIRAAATSSPEDAVEIAAQLETNGADVVPALLETAARRQQQAEAAAIDQADLLERTRNAPESIRSEPAPVEAPTDGWGTRANPPEDTLAALRVPTTGTGWGAPTAQGVAIEQTRGDVSNALPQRTAPAPSAAPEETAPRAEREPLPELPDLPPPPPVVDPAEARPVPQFRVVLPDGRIFGTYSEQRDAEGALTRAGADARIELIGPTTSVELDTPAVPMESAPAPSVEPMLMSSGKPFKSAKLAASSAKQRRLNMEPVKVPGGWGLVPNTQTNAAPSAPAAPKIHTFGWDRVKLAQHSFEDLEQLRQQVTAQHANSKDEAGHPIENGQSTIHLIDQAGRRKLDALAMAVYYKQQQARRAEAGTAPAPVEQTDIQSTPAAPEAAPAQAIPADTQPNTAAPVATVPTAAPAPRKRTARAPDGRPALLAQIDQAKAKTGDPAAVAEYQDLQARINQARREAALKKTKPARSLELTSWADNAEADLAQLRERIGYVRFTSGGARYKVLNAPAHLEAFAKKVRSTAAFRTAPADWEAIYDQIETRPGSTEAQLDAGRHAVRDVFRWVNVRLGSQLGLDPADRGPISVLGSALSDGFAEHGGARLVGQTVESPADLAALAQVYRDPRFETFRVFYTDDTGRIIGEAGYSSRLPAAVYLPNIVGDIQRDAAAYKASGYHVLHNHPSGRSAPSPADLSLTRQIAAAVPGFLSHVVIDHNEYSVIEMDGSSRTIAAPELDGIDFSSRPELAHHLLGTMITTPVQVAELAKALQIEGGHSTMVFTRRDGAVQLLVDLPTDLLGDDSKVGVAKLKGVVRRAARAVGAGGHRFVVLPTGADFTGLEHLVTKGIFVDIVTADGSSIRDRGTWFPGDFLDSGIKPAARVAEPYSYETERLETAEQIGGHAAWAAAGSELTYPQWVEAHTPHFRLWFRDSKAVAANGEPLVLHPTASDVTVQGKNGQPEQVKQPGLHFAAGDGTSNGPGVWLSLQNPAIVDMAGDANSQRLQDLLYRAMRRDHDGAIVRGWAGGADQYVVFGREQVRSAARKAEGLDLLELDTDIVREPGTDYAVNGTRPGQSQPATVAQRRAGIERGANRNVPRQQAAGVSSREQAARYTPPRIPQQTFTPPAAPQGRLASWTDAVVYQLQNKLVDLKATQDAIRASGRSIRDEFDPFQAETLMHGKAAYRTQAFLEDEVEPILRRLKAHAVSAAQLEEYLHARHAPERNARMMEANPNAAELAQLIAQAQQDVQDAELDVQQAAANGAGLGAAQRALVQAEARLSHLRNAKPWSGTEDERRRLSGMSDAEAAAILDRIRTGPKAAVFQKLGELIDDMTARTRAEMAGYGLESVETVTAMGAQYQHYVPLQRDLEDSDLLQGGNGTGAGMSIRGSKVKRATGSLRAVENILANIVAQREQTIARGEKNRVSKALYGMMLEHPNPDFWAVVSPQMGARELRTQLQAMGIDPATIDTMVDAPTVPAINPRTGLAERRVHPGYASMPNAVVLRVNGEDRVMLFSPKNDRAVRLAQALKNADRAWFVGGPIVELIGKATRYLAAINTQYNPVFGLTNFVRDVQGMALNLTTTPIAGRQRTVTGNLPSAFRGIWNWERGDRSHPWAAIYQDFLAAGGQTGYRDQFATIEDRARDLQRKLAGRPIRDAAGIRQTLDLLSDYNTAIENATRLAAYKAALDAGMSKAQAAHLAKDITVNFNRKGASSGAFASLYAFFNAAVQGSERTLRVLRGPGGQKILAGGVALGALQAVAGFMMLGGGDGDDWDDIPEFERAKNLILPLPGEGSRYLKLPMPLGFHAIPNLGRVLTEMMLYRDRIAERAGGLLLTTMDAFNPLGSGSVLGMVSPSITDPAIELAANRNAFGREIYREDMSALDPTTGHSRAKEGTGRPFVAASRAINRATGGDEDAPGFWSPTAEELAYVFGTATGGLGREIDKALTAADAQLTGDRVPPYRVPIVGRFYGEAGGEVALRQRYFKVLRDINVAENQMKGRAKRGEEFSEGARLGALAPAARRFQSAVRDIAKARYGETDKARRKELDVESLALQRQLVELATQAKAPAAP